MTGVPLVAVLLGTDHHPFDRLVRWVDELDASMPADWFVQHGATVLPSRLAGEPMLTPSALHDLMVRADAVVCHGGPGLIMEARAAGHDPVVVPRDPGRGEHVDDHQQRFVGFLSRQGQVTTASSAAGLATAVEHAVGAAERHLGTGPGSTTSLRFGSLVDSLLQRT